MIENEALTAVDEPEIPAGEPEGVIAETDENTVDAADSPRAKLTLKRSGAETEDTFEFGSPALVGRFDPSVGPIDVDLGTLDEGVYVSRKHARFTWTDGVWSVEDLGSSNGTFILRSDFERVESVELRDGDEISFGNARFVFRVL